MAHWAGLPLAAMLGALFATMIASLMGAPIAAPMPLRAAFLTVVGLFLGQSVGADAGARIGDWWPSLILAAAYAPAAVLIGWLVFRLCARMDRTSAFLASIPGGLTAIILLAESLGGDERKVALAQAQRVTLVVVAAPALFFGALGYAAGPDAAAAAPAALTLREALLLIPAAGAALLALRRIGAPIPFLIGPALAAAALRMTGLVEGALPDWLLEVALLVVGAAIGARFAGESVRAILGLVGWTALNTAALLALSGLFAAAAVFGLGVAPAPAALAFAPGGVAEMALIALAIDADPSFVAAHHFARIAFILAAAPAAAAWLARRSGRSG